MRKSRTIDEYEFESFSEIFKFIEESPSNRQVVYRDDCYVKDDGGGHYYLDMDDCIINLDDYFDDKGNVKEEQMKRVFLSVLNFTGREYTLTDLKNRQ